MSKNPVVPGRMTADLDGEFVVFLIGMRINKPGVCRGAPAGGAEGRSIGGPAAASRGGMNVQGLVHERVRDGLQPLLPQPPMR
ncbi:MAG TPA: hypothetical protein VFE14_16005, partial [Micromonosporaceae bacterium]|nr:hypothetical protein [Micromonosporaceae bacterium]